MWGGFSQLWRGALASLTWRPHPHGIALAKSGSTSEEDCWCRLYISGIAKEHEIPELNRKLAMQETLLDKSHHVSAYVFLHDPEFTICIASGLLIRPQEQCMDVHQRNWHSIPNDCLHCRYPSSGSTLQDCPCNDLTHLKDSPCDAYCPSSGGIPSEAPNNSDAFC